MGELWSNLCIKETRSRSSRDSAADTAQAARQAALTASQLLTVPTETHRELSGPPPTVHHLQTPGWQLWFVWTPNLMFQSRSEPASASVCIVFDDCVSSTTFRSE